MRIGKGNRRWKVGVEIMPYPGVKCCNACGKRLERKRRKDGRLEEAKHFNARKYCDRTCANTGKYNPNYGKIRRKSYRWLVENGSTVKFHQSKEWVAKRDEIFKRDNYTCQKCDRDANILRKDGLKLHCHHIKAICEGGELFDNDNLITLCEECHKLCHPEVKFWRKEICHIREYRKTKQE